MNDKDSLREQLNELLAIYAIMATDTCMQDFWTPSYYEGDQNLKDQMARFVNLQYNRRMARRGVLADLDKRIELIRSALE